MWLFYKGGHFSLGQQAGEPDIMLIRTQLREEMNRVVALLDAVGGTRHESQEIAEPHYRFFVAAKRATVTQAVARMIGEVNYSSFLHACHFDFGAQQPGFLLWMNRAGLQVATVREPHHGET